MSNFSKHSLLKHVRSLASYMPNNKLFFSKYKEGSELNNLTKGLAGEMQRSEHSIVDLFNQHDLTICTDLIDEWESALGIPDGIFNGTGDIEERRNHCIVKLTMSVQTTQDFIDLGLLLGYDDIEIFPLVNKEYLPVPVPFVPWFGYQARFIAVVVGTGITPKNPPYNVPFDVGGDSSIIIDLFDKLKPAHTLFIYEDRAQ